MLTEDSKTKKRKIKIPDSHISRIVCDNCGNDSDFFEVADGVILTTRYIQNADCSFSQDGDETQILGQVRLYCADCNQDMSKFHRHFVNMLF